MLCVLMFKPFFSLSTTRIARYQDLFSKLNAEDKHLVALTKKTELETFCKTIGFNEQVPQLDEKLIDEFLFIQVCYRKPLSAESRIRLRNKMLPYLEKSDCEQASFIESVLKYYECI